MSEHPLPKNAGSTPRQQRRAAAAFTRREPKWGWTKPPAKSWLHYKVGNGLRGHIYFRMPSAATMQEVWDEGRRLFNDWIPPGGSVGRGIWVWRARYFRVYLTTKWTLDQEKLSPKERHFSNHQYPHIDIAWQTIIGGSSGQKKLVLPKGKPAEPEEIT